VWQRTLNEAICWLEKVLDRLSSNVIAASFALMISQFILFGLLIAAFGGLSRFLHDLHIIMWPVVFSLVMVSVKNYSNSVRQLGLWLTQTADMSKIRTDDISRLSSKLERLILGNWASVFAVLAYVSALAFYIYWVWVLGNYTLVEQNYLGPFVIGMVYTSIVPRTFALLVIWGFIEAVGGTICWMCASTVYTMYKIPVLIPLRFSTLDKKKTQVIERLVLNMLLMLASVGLIFALRVPFLLLWGTPSMLLSILEYFGYTAFLVLVFFASGYGIHRFMSKMKRSELDVVEQRFLDEFNELMRLLAGGDTRESERSLHEVALVILSLRSIRDDLKVSSEWPFNKLAVLKAVGVSFLPLFSPLVQISVQLLWTK